MGISNSKNNLKVKFILTILSAGMAVVINYAISLVLTPYITENLGTDAYGFVSLAKNISQYAIVFTAALNAYAARFITVAHHSKNKSKEKQYFCSVFLANVFISIFIIIIAAVLIIFIDKILNIPIALINDVRILLFLNFVNYLVISTGTCFSVYGYIFNNLTINNVVKAITYILEAIALLFFFRFFPPHVYYVGIALLVSSLLMFVINYIICSVKLPNLKLSTKHFSFSAVKELVLSGIWNSINSLGNILNTGLDLLVSNILLSTVMTGQVSIVKTLATIFETLFQMLFSPFQPILLKHYSQNNKKALIKTFNKSIKFSAFFSCMIFAGVTAFGFAYYRLWVPSEDHILLQRFTIITLIGVAFEGPIYPLFYTYTLTLKNKIPCAVTIIGGLFNVLCKFILIKNTELGIYSIALTTTLVSIIIYFIFTPIYSAYCLEIRISSFYPTILRTLAGSVIVLLICLAISKVYYPHSWFGLIISACICCLVCLPFYILIVVSKEELQNIKNIFSKIRRKLW